MNLLPALDQQRGLAGRVKFRLTASATLPERPKLATACFAVLLLRDEIALISQHECALTLCSLAATPTETGDGSVLPAQFETLAGSRRRSRRCDRNKDRVHETALGPTASCRTGSDRLSLRAARLGQQLLRYELFSDVGFV